MFSIFLFYPFFFLKLPQSSAKHIHHPFWSARSPFGFNVFQYAVSDICFRSALFFRRQLIFIPVSAHFSIYLPTLPLCFILFSLSSDDLFLPLNLLVFTRLTLNYPLHTCVFSSRLSFSLCLRHVFMCFLAFICI